MGEGLGERALLVLHSDAASLSPESTVSPLRRLTFFKRQKSKQKRCAPPSGSRCARLPSLHHCSEGTPRRAIPGPARLTLYTTIPFGLLKGAIGAELEIVTPQGIVDKLRVVYPDFCGYIYIFLDRV